MPTAVPKAAASALRSVHDLSQEEKRALMRREFTRQSRLQEEFGADAVELDCGPYTQMLRAEVLRLLKAKGIAVPSDHLPSLHQHLSQEFKDYNFDDGVNKISTLLYDADKRFMAAYHRFIQECVAHYFPYPFYFQATVTIRVHCPGGANAHHYPRYHNDIGYGHPPQEINLWLPLTDPVPPQQHGFRRMSVADSCRVLEQFDYDFAPFIDKAINDPTFNAELHAWAPQVTTPFGKMLAFDSRCIHTGEPLLHHTRVSMDIRILPVQDFSEMTLEYQGTGRRRMRYVPGQGYHALASHQL